MGQWDALGAAAGSGGQFMNAFLAAKQQAMQQRLAEQKAAQEAANTNPQYNPKDFGIENAPTDFKLNRAEAAGFLKSQQGAGAYNLGMLLGLDPNDPRANIPVGSKAAPGIVAQGVGMARPTAEQSASMAEAGQMAELGGKLGEQWKASGFNAPSGTQAAKGFAAGLLPGSISQRTLGPEYTQFQDTKSILSEVALRAATGAAAPTEEKKQYAGYLPDPGDSPDIARNKIDNFFGRIKAKANATATGLEAQGLKTQADYYRRTVIQDMERQKQDLLRAFIGAERKQGGGGSLQTPSGVPFTVED